MLPDGDPIDLLATEKWKVGRTMFSDYFDGKWMTRFYGSDLNDTKFLPFIRMILEVLLAGYHQQILTTKELTSGLSISS